MDLIWDLVSPMSMMKYKKAAELKACAKERESLAKTLKLGDKGKEATQRLMSSGKVNEWKGPVGSKNH